MTLEMSVPEPAVPHNYSKHTTKEADPIDLVHKSSHYARKDDDVDTRSPAGNDTGTEPAHSMVQTFTWERRNPSALGDAD